MTNDLSRRVSEHKRKVHVGFTSKYNVGKLIYYERFDFVELAIKRETQIKSYSRMKKEKLINGFNPKWEELYENGAIRKSTFLDKGDKKSDSSITPTT